MNYWTTLLFCVLSFNASAQIHINRCQFDETHRDYFYSPRYLQDIELEQQTFLDFLNQKKTNENYTIPVVVHIVKNPQDTLMSISDEDVYRQIEILNERFNLLNEDTLQVPDLFKPDIGNPQIEFCLATVDPQGFLTSGITRTNTDVLKFSSISDNIKHSDQGGVDAWDTNAYLNIWVGNISTGVLGYAHLPNANVEEDEHGLVIGYSYFGETSHPQYGNGKTAVHELGHYLNLKHPWGLGNCDQNNDFVEDTPASENAYSGIPVHPQESCGTVDMFMNYMDYVDDTAMVMFSIGQADRMQFALNYYRGGLLESNGCGTPILYANPIIAHNSASGISDASIDLNLISGIAPFSVTWSHGPTTQLIDNLDPGSYSATITDDVGQTLSLNFEIGYLGQLIDSDNFESYTIDSLLEVQSDTWLSFCADSFSANLENIAAPEGSQYLEINAADGSNTFARYYDDIQQNAFNLSFQLYIPDARAGYYSIYHDTNCTEPQLAYSVQFNINGSGSLFVANETHTFNFPQSQWFEVRQLVDLDRDLVELFIAGQKIMDWPFEWTTTDTDGSADLAALVFNSQIDTFGLVHYFVDDYKLSLTSNSEVGTTNLSDIPTFKVYPNPAKDMIYINGGSLEPAHVILVNSIGQVICQYEWDGLSVLPINMMHFDDGFYTIRLSTSTGTHAQQFVLIR